MRYAAVFVGFFLLGTFGYLFYQTYSQPETLLAVTTHDKIKELKLPDGTKVWLNKNTPATLVLLSDAMQTVSIRVVSHWTVIPSNCRKTISATACMEVRKVGNTKFMKLI